MTAPPWSPTTRCASWTAAETPWKTGLPREIQSLLSEEGGLTGQESGTAAGIPAYVPREQERTHQYITVKHGLDVLHDAGLNKARAPLFAAPALT